ncbi:transglutaminase-like domain-containing protein [Amaricoccus macauensis]|uniref:transglutaminase-like domain-containing protein n=1 Tax=Amaricoccus macauensis TaxID=57001 RepID=UPI003C7A7EAE
MDDDSHKTMRSSVSGIRVNIKCRLRYSFPQPTPLIALLSVHYSRFSDLERADHLVTTPSVPLESYRDGFGNWCTRLLAPEGDFCLSTDGIFRDTGEPDPRSQGARQHAVQDLPSDTLAFLQGSRYCDTDLLSEMAWETFETIEPGWTRVEAICDFVHNHVRFDYTQAKATRTASQTLAERQGVCRDFAHLAMTLCRCMNIPARYCTGYLSDIGEPLPHPPGDFAAWMEVFLGGEWNMFDPRNNTPRFARIMIAHGRDAVDVPLTQTFDPNTLTEFKVWSDETVWLSPGLPRAAPSQTGSPVPM